VASGSTETTPQSAVLPELEPEEEEPEDDDEEPDDEEPDDEEPDDEEPDDEEPDDEEPDDVDVLDEDPMALELEPELPLLAEPSSAPAPELDVELPLDVEASSPPPVDVPTSPPPPHATTCVVPARSGATRRAARTARRFFGRITGSGAMGVQKRDGARKAHGLLCYVCRIEAGNFLQRGQALPRRPCTGHRLRASSGAWNGQSPFTKCSRWMRRSGLIRKTASGRRSSSPRSTAPTGNSLCLRMCSATPTAAGMLVAGYARDGARTDPSCRS
jgi:hypothetical protein